MKKGWQTKTLGELCSFENGDRGENYPSRSVQTSSGVPFINAGHLSESGIDFSSMNYIPRERFELLGNGKIRKEDILFCLRGSLGKFASVGELSEGAIASSLIIIRPSDAILNRFILAYLQSDLCAEMIQKFRNGAAQPNLSAASLKKFSIPFPPLAEQQRIITILDEAFAGLATAKANAEKNLQNARALFESHLDSVFERRSEDWIETTLEKILSTQPRNGWSPPAANHSDTGTPVLTLSSVTGFQFRPEKIKYTSAPTDIRRHYWVNNGDFLITRSNTPELVGHVAIASGIDQPTIYPDLIMRMNPNSEIMMTEFLYYQLRTPKLRSEITSRAQGANPTMKKLNKEAVQTLPICVPTLPTQKSIVNTLNSLADEVGRLSQIYERKLTALDELKQSLLHQAFSGQL